MILDIYLAYKVQVNQTTVQAGSRGWVQQGNISMACNKGIIIGHKQAGIAIDVLIGCNFHSDTLMLSIIKHYHQAVCCIQISPFYTANKHVWTEWMGANCQPMMPTDAIHRDCRR